MKKKREKRDRRINKYHFQSSISSELETLAAGGGGGGIMADIRSIGPAASEFWPEIPYKEHKV